MLLLDNCEEKWIALFSLLQFGCFPWGLLGFLDLPGHVLGFVSQTNDRESVVDMPFVEMSAGAVWLPVAGLIGWRMWRAWKHRARTNRGQVAQ